MARSLTEAELLDATAAELSTYLRSGTLNTHALADSLAYEGLDIDDWERVKRIHFCLSTPVRKFITQLPDRVRRIKTEHQRDQRPTRGEVRGAIDWSATLRTRAESGYVDQSRFVCNTPYTEYDIPENRVLKRLLWVIHRTVSTDLEPIEYDWRHEYWSDDQIRDFIRLYRQNVHLNRISDGQSLSVTSQDMTTARRSRLSLYTDAYELYDAYQRLQADTFDPDITELLANTLVIPTRAPQLYELFCCFRVIRTLNAHTPGFRLQPIDGDTDALARFKSDDRRIDVYHDRTGTLSFYEPLDGDRPTHPQFARYHDALTDYATTLETLTGSSHEPVLYNGRPDLIIELYDTTSQDELLTVLIGEVKYSDAKQTFKRGLAELLTYRRFGTADDVSLLDNPDISVAGLLITNGITTSGTSDRLVHCNGSDLLANDSASSQQPDWIRPLTQQLPEANST